MSGFGLAFDFALAFPITGFDFGFDFDFTRVQ